MKGHEKIEHQNIICNQMKREMIELREENAKRREEDLLKLNKMIDERFNR